MYNIIYLGLGAGIFLALFRRGDAERLLALMLLAILVPREFNARPHGLSFCLTDAALLAFLWPWLTRPFSKISWNRETGFLLAGLAFIGAWTLLSLRLPGPINRHMFIKDAYAYVAFFLVLLALANSTLTWSRNLLFACLACLYLLGITAVAIDIVPPLRDLYIAEHIKTHALAREIGYFDPGNGVGPFTDVPGQLRISDFVGGAPLADFLVMTLPVFLFLGVALFGTEWRLVAALSFLFFASLYLYSRSLTGAIFVGVLLCLRYPEKRKLAFKTLVSFTALFFCTPVGWGLLRRFHLLELGGMEVTNKNMVFYNIRISLFTEAIDYIKQSPWLGMGLGHTRQFSFGLRSIMSDGVDSLPLTLLLKFGVLGGAVFGMLFGVLGLWSYRVYRRPAEAVDAAKTSLPALLAFLFFSLFSYPFNNISLTVFVACFLGLSYNGIRAGVRGKE